MTTPRALALALALSAAPAAAQGFAVGELPAQPPGAALPAQMVGPSLLADLVAVGETDLLGLFTYMPASNAAPAFADFLYNRRSALKKFLKKTERDLKDYKGVNAWDREVCMFLTQINGGALPPGMERLPHALDLRVANVVLAQPLSLDDMTARRPR